MLAIVSDSCIKIVCIMLAIVSDSCIIYKFLVSHFFTAIFKKLKYFFLTTHNHTSTQHFYV
jgi:hypothetical protein